MVSTPSIVELAGVVIPDSTRRFSIRIKEGGYEWVNDQITAKRFPLTLPAGPRKLVLVHFGKDMTSKQVATWAKMHSYEVSPIDDLFAIGAHPKYRDLQLHYPIVALGSSAVIDDDRSVPCLGRYASGRSLPLYRYEDGWNADFRFLLRKTAPID